MEIGRLRREAKILKGMLPNLYRDDDRGERVHILRTATFPKLVRRPIGPGSLLRPIGEATDEQGLTEAQRTEDDYETTWTTEQDIKE